MAKKQTSADSIRRCRDCSYSRLARNGTNPIIAICELKRERFVANAVTVCKEWKPYVGKAKEVGCLSF